MKIFWRVTPLTNSDRQLQGRSELKRDSDFINRLRVGHGLIMADWDDQSRKGITRALGIVLSIDAPQGSAFIEWRKNNTEFHPNPQGGVAQWRKPQGWFSFAKNVAERYGISSLFQKAFPDKEKLDYGKTVKLGTEGRPHNATASAGFVYLVKSEHGYKIGKSINVKARTQMFGVKLPFDIEVIHYSFFDDYSEAERSLHRRFQHKRLQGEWFDLNDQDIEAIKKLGQPASLDNL